MFTLIHLADARSTFSPCSCCISHVRCCSCFYTVTSWSKSLRNFPKIKPDTCSEWLNLGGKKNAGEKSYKFFRIQVYVQRMHRDKIIDDDTRRFLIQTDPKPGRFYILPKIHKQGNPGRPIVSRNSHPTERISQFVDYHLKPLVQTTQSFIKDTTHFFHKLEQLGQLPNNAFLVTLDVSSLYTNIPHNHTLGVRGYLLFFFFAGEASEQRGKAASTRREAPRKK